ncbi:recombinase family protein [Streptosporangium sp. CA-135522]|uniref:recombinase family protein n=1 Tax=Streptosporangium sp. CA-135522 TaxID=3240072 RepID=UPI003D911BC0
MRVLAVKRISRDSEQSSALERQEVQLAEAIRKGRHTVAGWVEDATVSGAVNLHQRPSLGRWLAEPLVHEWDALMVTSQDRISRDDLHWHQFVGWVLANDKTVIILDDPSFNLADPNGRMIAGIKASQAANYRNAVREKRMNQTAHYREENLWPGGTWPFGYRAVRVQHNGATRWRLAIDPVTGPLVREAYERLVNQNHSMGTIVKDWNARGVLTTLDYQRHVNATEGRDLVKSKVKGSRWATTSLRVVLTKPSLMGYAMHKGEVRRKDGLPVVWADPILSREEFDQLQEVIEGRTRGKGLARATTPLVGVVFCKCGQPLYSNSSTKKLTDGTPRHYSYYVCRTWSLGTRCEWVKSWPKDFVQDYIDDAFMNIAGDLEVTVRAFVPGVDRSKEIAGLQEALENLNGNLAYLKPGSTGAINAIRAIEEHERAIAELEAIPVVPSRYDETGTGETYRELWNRTPEWESRAELLRVAGFRFYFAGATNAPEIHIFTPEHLAKRINDAHTGSAEPSFVEGVDMWTGNAMADRRTTEAEMRTKSHDRLAQAMEHSQESEQPT